MDLATRLHLVLTLLFAHCFLSIQARRTRIQKIKVEQANGMVIVRPRSLEEPFVLGNSNSSLESVNLDEMYGEWSKWSKCRKKCKKVRSRVCKAPALCQTSVMKEEKSCTGDRCRMRHPHHRHPEHQQNPSHGRGRSRAKQFKVLYYMQNYIYSQWTKWSACSESCQTYRRRTCEMKQICRNRTIQEDALCYTQGSHCEKLYKPKIQPHSQRLEEEKMPNVESRPMSSQPLIDDEKCGNSSSSNNLYRMLRIIGGRVAPKGRWPWVVTILNQNREAFCGGTLVSPQFVVTAAHCVRNRLFVRAGEHHLFKTEGSEQRRRVLVAIEHPKYDPDTVDNDIALLKLHTPFEINNLVSPICLPSPNDEMSVDSRGTILGWGKKWDLDSHGTHVLHEAEVPIVGQEDCRNVYKDKYMITDNMVCAGFKRGMVDSCAGDSGGPLLFSKKTQLGDKWYLYGITSFGEGCGKKNKYGIYAKVPNLVNWIRKAILENSDY